MAKGNEKRDILIAIRVSEEQNNRIRDNAAKRGMTVSSYVTYTAAQGNGITPEILARMQNIVNCAADAESKIAPEKKTYMEREMNSLWSLLK